MPDRKTGETTRVSIDSEGKQANGTSFGAAISTDGRYAAFSYNATNLVNTDKTMAVFVPDRETGRSPSLAGLQTVVQAVVQLSSKL